MTLGALRRFTLEEPLIIRPAYTNPEGVTEIKDAVLLSVLGRRGLPRSLGRDDIQSSRCFLATLRGSFSLNPIAGVLQA